MKKSTRKDLCPCGSGKKYATCCGATRADLDGAAVARPTNLASAVPDASLTLDAAARLGVDLASLASLKSEPVSSDVSEQPPQSPPESPTTPAASDLHGVPTHSARKLVLAYPTHSIASAPPLGVCALKGFLRRAAPEWQVKVLDLNLEAHTRLIEQLSRERVFLGSEIPEGAVGEIALSRAAETFRGLHPQEFYERPDRLVHYALLWNKAVTAAFCSQANLHSAFFGRGPMPELINRHLALVLQEQPAVVGLSVCYSAQLAPALCLAKALKSKAQLAVVLGGTFFNQGLDASWQTQLWPVDYVVEGMGEHALAAILSGEAAVRRVPGVLQIEEGRVRDCPPDYPKDLDELGEPDFSDLDLCAYFSPEPVVPVLTSRGCYWRRCAFCTHYRSSGTGYHTRSIGAVIAELKGHVARGVRHFSFVDDIVSPARFSDLAKAILEEGLDINYYAMAKPVRQFDPSLLSLLSRSGCRFLLWGLESGSQRVLDLMDKGTQVGEVEKVLDDAAAAGVRNHVFVICGFPTETQEEFQATVDLLRRHKTQIARVHKSAFTLEKDSPIHQSPERFSITRMTPSATLSLYQYECSTGMSAAQARRVLNSVKPFLRSFDCPLPDLPDLRFRDHLLLLYSRERQR